MRDVHLSRMLWRKRASSRVAYTDVLPEVACDAPDPLEGAAAVTTPAGRVAAWCGWRLPATST